MGPTVFAILGLAGLVGFIAGMWVARARGLLSPSRLNHPVATTQPEICKRCGQRIEVDLDLSIGALEGMHWLCFHLEFEHDTDPDLPCGDIAGCPWWTIRYYEERLEKLGIDPTTVRQQGLESQWKVRGDASKDA